MIKIIFGICCIFSFTLLSIANINGIEKDNNIQIPTILSNQTIQWNTYENINYGIKLSYPSNWIKWEEDIAPGDYVTNIGPFKAPFDTNNKEIKKGL